MTTQLLTADDVARLLGVTRAQVLKLRRLHPRPIPAVDVSAGSRPSYRWRPSTVENFLRNRRAA